MHIWSSLKYYEVWDEPLARDSVESSYRYTMDLLSPALDILPHSLSVRDQKPLSCYELWSMTPDPSFHPPLPSPSSSHLALQHTTQRVRGWKRVDVGNRNTYRYFRVVTKGTNSYWEAPFLMNISELNELPLICLYFHWGKEFSFTPSTHALLLSICQIVIPSCVLCLTDTLSML